MRPAYTRVLLLAAAATGFTAAPAHGANYKVESCHGADGAPLSSAAWGFSKSRTGPTRPVKPDPCLSGHVMGDVLKARNGATRSRVMRWVFRAPRGTWLGGVSLQRQLVAGDQYGYSLDAVVGRGKDTRSVRIEDCTGPEACSALGSRAAASLPANTRALVAQIACRATRCSPTSAGVQLLLTRAEVNVVDSSLPSFVRIPRGQFVSSVSGQHGLRKFRFSARDTGGGLRSIAVVVDDATVVTLPIDRGKGTCTPPLVSRRSCPLRVTRTYTIDTGGLLNGAHLVRFVLADATGANTVTAGPYLISVSNPGHGPFASVSAGLVTDPKKRPRQTLRTTFGTKTFLVGRVTDSAGAPLNGVTVDVQAFPAGLGTPGAPEGAAVTDADGKFGVPVEPGPTRTLVAISRLSGVGGMPGAAQVRASVVPKVSFQVSPHRLRNGQRIDLTGTVTASPMPQIGLLVELQAQRGHIWQTFRVVRANAQGNFSTRYRFSNTVRTTRYRLRAHVPRQGGFPFDAGNSRGRAVVVRGG